MEASVELKESPNGNLESGIGIEGRRRAQKGRHPLPLTSSSSTPAVVAPPPIRFDESIVDAAYDREWDQVKSLHEEGISLDSVDEVRGSHHYTIMTCSN